MKEKVRCAGLVPGYVGHRCRNTGRLEHEGKMFCKLHHPPTAQQKRDASYAKFEADWALVTDEYRLKEICSKVGLAQLRHVFLGMDEPENWGLSEADLEFVKSMLVLPGGQKSWLERKW